MPRATLPIPNPGEMRHTAIIERREVVTGDRGQNTASWTEVTTLKVKIETLSGLELIRARKIWERSTYRLTAWATADDRPLPEDRARFDGRVFEIGHVRDEGEMGLMLVILCSEET